MPIADAYTSPNAEAELQPVFPLDIYQCERCWHAQLLDVVDPDLLFANYRYRTSSSPGLVDHFGRYAQRLDQQFGIRSGELVVDIGSNDGTLLRFFQDRGMRCLGIDPAKEIARAATEAGVPTVPAYFTLALARKLLAEHGPASIVTANNAFAHTDDLGEIVSGVRELLADDGVFVFEASYLVDLVDKTLLDTIYHEHVSYHSVAPLRTLFHRHGMQLFNVERIGTKGGSIRGFVQKLGGGRAVSGAVEKLVNLEADRGLNGQDGLKSFAKGIEQMREDLRRCLTSYLEEGRVVVGFGAAQGATTLVYQLDLGQCLSFLVDDNLARQGTLSPGYRIPVLDSAALYRRPAHCVVILAWAYAEQIIGRHRRFLKDGGTFVVPIPHVRQIGATG